MRSLVLFMMGVVGACGTDVTADQACNAVAHSRCVQLMTCSAADFAARWPDLTTCETREKLACTESQAAPKTAATPPRTDDCAGELNVQACAAFLSGVVSPVDCLSPSGPGLDASACAFNGQCSSAFCSTASDSLCGTCATPPVAGDSCASQGCGPTMNCVAATQLCQVPGALADACNKDLPCGTSLACVGSTTTVMGSCMQKIADAGTACDATLKTGPNCDATVGLACDTAMKVCVTQPVAAAGQPCGVVTTDATRCEGGATCFIPATATTGTCVAPAADGAACDDTVGPSCLTPAKCVSGTCQLPGSTTCS